MSVMFIKLDSSSLYNRAVMLLYTRLSRQSLCEYIGGLELLADDRLSTFFKIVVEIQKTPKKLSIENWYFLSINLKSFKKHSLPLFINWFCKEYPHKLQVNSFDINDQSFLCSGNLNDGPLSQVDVEIYHQLTSFNIEYHQNIVFVSREFKKNQLAKDAKHVVDVLIDLAKRYNVYGGRWLLFFNDVKPVCYEKTFDYLLQNFCHPDLVEKVILFNAKISKTDLFISFGNEFTKAAVDPLIMQSKLKQRDNIDEDVFYIRTVLDKIYNADFLGGLVMKYKPGILSDCCIQRNNVHRTTVYERSYFPYYATWKWNR